jgi:polar amino acid transport system substrate-binding protein
LLKENISQAQTTAMRSFFRLLLLCGFILLYGCGDKATGTADTGKAASGIKLKSPDDIRDKLIGVLLGSLYDKYATDNYPDARILHYQTVTDLLTALNAGKINVVFYPQSSVFEMLAANPDLGILARDIFFVPLGAGFNRNNDELREQFNSFLKEIRANGVYDDMVKRWMEQRIMELPEIRGSTVNGILRTGVVNDIGMPFGSVRNGKLIGFDIELSSRFAAHIGREFAPVPLEFGSLIASISTNKIDIITASMAVTEERAKMIDFSDPYYDSGVVLVARKDAMDPSVPGAAGVESADKPFLKRVSESFHNNMIQEKRYLLILDGLKLTILISIFAALLGTLLGGLICGMRMSKNRILSALAAGYINLLRGTPVLVLLMIIYYIVFSAVNIDPGLVAVIAFGMNFAAYVSEMFRTSIASIDKGQVEAGIAGGFTRAQTFIRITAPQALVHLLPVYKGEFISLIKMTSIVGYIAVQDLTKAGDIIRSRTFDAFFPLLLAAAIYLALAWLLTWALGLVEVSVDPRRRKPKHAGT